MLSRVLLGASAARARRRARSVGSTLRRQPEHTTRSPRVINRTVMHSEMFIEPRDGRMSGGLRAATGLRFVLGHRDHPSCNDLAELGEIFVEVRVAFGLDRALVRLLAAIVDPLHDLRRSKARRWGSTAALATVIYVEELWRACRVAWACSEFSGLLTPPPAGRLRRF